MKIKMMLKKLHTLSRSINVGHEVRNALETKRPVVALESTIITHGMPYPHNVETALAVEQIIRDQKAIPATVGIIGGKFKIGLTQEEIQSLATFKDVVKTSRRDIPYVLSQGKNGGTTVSATMIAANSVGIQVFVTGGIGGVHRQGELTMDISADLTELGRTPIAVICSGVKSILDIGRTLEYLETQGVCVAAYGPTKDFPAFYCRSSRHKAPYNVTSPEEAANLIKAVHSLHLQSGVVIAVPIPKEYELIDEDTMERSILEALELTNERNITGKAVTPFILDELAKVTAGRSLESNIELVKNNASVGARIAVALSNSSSVTEPYNKGKTTHNKSEPGYAKPRSKKSNIVVVGGSNLDAIVSVTDEFKVEGRTLNGQIKQVGGGVGRNLADALGKLDMSPVLVSAVGDDLYGQFILHKTLSHIEHSGILVSPELPTASYSVVLDNKGVFRIGVGDMDIHSLITPDVISSCLQDASAVIMDGNIPSTSITYIVKYCSDHGIPVIFEPTDVAKADIPFQTEAWKCFHLISPNVLELKRIASSIGLHVGTSEQTSIEEVVSLAMPIAEYIQTVMVTLGSLGVLMVGREQEDGPITARYYPTQPLDSVLSVSGAGDCLAAVVVKGLLSGEDEPNCVSAGIAAANDSLRSYSAVPPAFTSVTEPVQYSLVDIVGKHSLKH